MADIPHFALPLRYVNGHAVVNEQDSEDDIADCVYAICVTNPGDRDDLPDFGVVDMTFSQEPIPASSLITQVKQWDDRVDILVDSAPDRFDATVVNANVYVQKVSS